MPAITQVSWYPERLTATLFAGYRASLEAAARDADAAGGAKAGAVIRGNTLFPTGLGAIYEVGAAPHRIDSRGRVLFLRGLNRYVTGGVDHPGRPARPYLGPAATRWQHAAPQIMRPFLRSAGFG